MNELLEKLKAYDWGGDRGALVGIDDLIAGAHRNQDTLAEIEAALLEVLQSDVKLPAKEYVCRQLALIGTASCVPALAQLLTDAEMSDRARLALEAIPGTAADDALRAALDKTSGIQRVGIINTLGERHDKKAAPMLSEMRNDPDGALSEAAAAALRKIEPPA